MKKQIISLIMSLFAMIFISGCLSFSSHQTAEVLKENEVEWGEGFGYYRFDFEVESYDNQSEVTKTHKESFSMPYFPETIFRFGVAENLDVGVKLAGVIANLQLDAKYQFLNTGDDVQNFSMAVQPFFSGVVFGPFSLYDMGVGLIASQRLNSRFVIYGNFKYHYISFGVNETNSGEENDKFDDAFKYSNNYTITAGASVEGKKWWIRPELTVFLNKEFKKIFILPALGFGLKF
jgi:hypothetical protein